MLVISANDQVEFVLPEGTTSEEARRLCSLFQEYDRTNIERYEVHLREVNSIRAQTGYAPVKSIRKLDVVIYHYSECRVL